MLNPNKPLDWYETFDDDASNPDRTVLRVTDGLHMHAAILDGETVEEGLANYASDYDRGDWQGEIVVLWQLLEQGLETGSGTYTF